MGACLVYYINKDLRIVSGELSNRLDLVVVQEDRRDQRDTLIHGKGMTDQPFPGRDFAVHEEPVKLTSVRSLE